MNWLTRLIENPKSLLSSKTESNTPEGLWVKCPGCSETLYNKELERACMVCPRCNQHLRIGAEERAKYLFDEGHYEELDTQLRSTDPLNFKDLKR